MRSPNRSGPDASATASRTRALVEERGLRAGAPGQRPPASVLGLVLERDGPAALGAHLARLAEAATLDAEVAAIAGDALAAAPAHVAGIKALFAGDRHRR